MATHCKPCPVDIETAEADEASRARDTEQLDPFEAFADFGIHEAE